MPVTDHNATAAVTPAGRTPRRRLAALSLASLLAVAACTGTGGSSTLPPIPSTTPETSKGPDASASAEATEPVPTVDISDCPTTQPPELPAGETRTVTLNTELGPIVIKVEGALAPIAAGNFVALAECGWYDNVVFHRLAPGFVIQGGDGQYGREPNVDPMQVGTGGPPYSFEDEPFGGDYNRGTVAMANSGPDTNGSQFFVCLVDLAGQLPKDYTIFGHVTEGMDVVDEIAAMPNSGPPANRALDPVAIQTVTVANP